MAGSLRMETNMGVTIHYKLNGSNRRDYFPSATGVAEPNTGRRVYVLKGVTEIAAYQSDDVISWVIDEERDPKTEAERVLAGFETWFDEWQKSRQRSSEADSARG